MPRVLIDFKKLPVSLAPEQYEWLRLKAFERKVPMSQIIRELVEKERLKDNPQGRLI